jgi:mannose-1-phosphate guanylyltransferase
MKAMILAAGRGTRVRPLTYDLPKPMIPILGKPVMEYLIEHLARHGVREIMVNTSHLAERIEQYFGDGRRFGAHIGYSFEGWIEEGKIVPFALGSAGGMKHIQRFGGFFDETAVVLCGDALVDLDLTLALEEHKRKGALVSVITKEVPRDQVSSYGIVVADEFGRIRAFQEKPSPAEAQSTWASAGIYLFEPAALDLIPDDRVFDIGGDLFPLLAKNGLPFYAQRHAFRWVDIGKVSDYWEATQRIMRGEIPGIAMPGKQRFPGIWTGLNTRIDWNLVHIAGPVFIGSNCRIDPGVEIVGPAWIGHGCHLERDARVVRSIIFEHTRVGANACFDEMIVCGDYCVGKDGVSVHRAEAQHASRWEDVRLERPALAA